MKTDQPLFLSEEQVRTHLRMTELIPAMEKALIDFSAGRVTQPVRSIISINPPGGFLGLMPALTPDGLGLKAVTFYPSNTERGIPTHMDRNYHAVGRYLAGLDDNFGNSFAQRALLFD